MAELDIKKEAAAVFAKAVSTVLPDEAVRRALRGRERPAGRRQLVAIGKAAWQMASAACLALDGDIDGGVVITKYGHSRGALPNVTVYEAGHPVPDDNTFLATDAALALTAELSSEDEVIFLVSGGGSALFEKPQKGISGADIARLTDSLIASGASIDEINILRKRFSAVKGGRFAAHCAPARIFQIVLSDVLGDRLDSIASGPACADTGTGADASRIIDKYGLQIPGHMLRFIEIETPKEINNVETAITGSVRELCKAASEEAERRGYTACLLTTTLNCEAGEAGRFIAALAREIKAGKSVFAPPCAVVMGGETVVRLRGKGKGGRSQELVLAAAEGIHGLAGTAVLCCGSDGTDGPTDAAGGVADGATWADIYKKGGDPATMLAENDSYHALKIADSLIITGPTGTNVNDLTLLLVRN